MFKLAQLVDITDPVFTQIEEGRIKGRAALNWIAAQRPSGMRTINPEILYHGTDQSGLTELEIRQPHLRANGKAFKYGFPAISATHDTAHAVIWGLKRSAYNHKNPGHRLWVSATPMAENRFAVTESLWQAMAHVTAKVYVLHPDGFEAFARDSTTLPKGWPNPPRFSSLEWRARKNQMPLMEIEVSADDVPRDQLKVVPDNDDLSWNVPKVPDLGRYG